MVKEGKELLAAYKEALFEGHDPDLPWAGRTSEQWAQFGEDLKPKQIKPKAPPPPPKPEPKVEPKPKPQAKKVSKKK